VTKTISAEDLAEAIRSVARGEAVLSQRLAGFVLDAFREPVAEAVDPELDLLTRREREILEHIARGYRYKEIAAMLAISARTVETHVSQVLRKLHLTNRHQLARWASQHQVGD
jgi:DNA-binding NarL/FixJ family response regulator